MLIFAAMQFVSEQLESADCPVKAQTQIAIAVEYRREENKNILLIKKFVKAI